MNDFDRNPDLPGFFISSGHDYIAQIKARGGTIVGSTELQSLGEADALLTNPGDGSRGSDNAIRHFARLYTQRRRDAEVERAAKRARERVRWSGIVTGKIEPPSIFTDGYGIDHVRSAKTAQRQKVAQDRSQKERETAQEVPPPILKRVRPRRPKKYHHPIPSAVRPDDALTVNEVAEIANVSDGAIRMQIARGHYPAYKVGSHIWISRAEYERSQRKSSPESRLLEAVDAIA